MFMLAWSSLSVSGPLVIGAAATIEKNFVICVIMCSQYIASAAADGGEEDIQPRQSRDRGTGEGGGGNRNKQRSLPRNY
jgi:hypothetical protein